ncbi:hypothetical protein DSO57_1005163 [Entomophthora muscae]|uniref:Uncharacterized protein n=1 Tax=Entomophthora muscae TaxID=34485 RepID=A0ACC2TVM2_9FUNG|nr:hypothetical protein DSO57_1005163 [Entomophthora muscae]
MKPFQRQAKTARVYYTFIISTSLFSSHKEESQTQLVLRSSRQETLALAHTEHVSPPPARALDHIIDPDHLPPLHQCFLCANQPVNQMSPPIEESPYFSYDYSKLGFAYVTLLEFTKQVIPHMSAWQTMASSVNYKLRFPPVVYWAFQDCPLSLVPVCRKAWYHAWPWNSWTIKSPCGLIFQL